MKNQIKQWERLGKSDPYWAVLSVPEKKGGKWDKLDFFQTGEDEIMSILEHLSNLKIGINKSVAIDYGCGVGRLTRALSKNFEKVIGIDISSSMLAEAQAVNSGFRNIDFFISNGRIINNIPDSSIDFIYSNITLQHSPIDAQISIVKEFLRILSDEGVAVFQTPSHEKISLKSLVRMVLGNEVLNIARRFLYGQNSVLEMHTFHQEKVKKVVEENSGAILQKDEVNSAGPTFVDMRYIIKKHTNPDRT